MKNTFKLSRQGKVAALLSMMLLPLVANADGVVPVGQGPKNPTLGTSGSGVAVVNIVAPNSNGLSHNQYLDFNVDKKGLILNNALSSGNSQLGGRVEANQNLHGNTAKIILNEVVSRNPSLLLGQQEVFGMAADYVLANPNGVTCNGCGFINTTRSSLVVGNPVLEQGNLVGYDTRNTDKSLQIGSDGIRDSAVLDLIAPSVQAAGNVRGGEAINVISGQQEVSRDSNKIANVQSDKVLADTYFLGSMQAGRIRLVGTNENSGINLSGKVSAKNELAIQSEGKVALQGAAKGGDISIAARNIEVKGLVDTKETASEGAGNYQDYRSGVYTSKHEITQKLKQASLEGGDISLVAKEDVHVTGAKVRGEQLHIKGNNITLDSQATTQTKENVNNRWKYSWKSDETKSSSRTNQTLSDIQIAGNIDVRAIEGDVNIQGAKLDTGNDLVIYADKDVHLAGVISSESKYETSAKKNETASLATGDHVYAESREHFHANELAARGNVGIGAGQNVSGQGVKIAANQDVVLQGQNVDVNVQKTSASKVVQDNLVYWGGIGGGHNNNDGNGQEVNHASDLSAGGKLVLSAVDGVSVTGSKVKGQEGAFVRSTTGNISVSNALDSVVDQSNNRVGTVFNITKNAEHHNNESSIVRRSEVLSDADLTVLSGNDVNVTASTLDGRGDLNIEAQGDVNVSSAANVTSTESGSEKLDASAYANNGTDQAKFGFHIEHTKTEESSHQETQSGSILSGSSVNLSSNQDITVTGSDILAKEGDANIEGKNISFLTAKNVSNSNSAETTQGGGLYLTLGADEIGVGAEGNHQAKKHTEANTTSVVSNTKVAGDLNITATDTLTLEGTNHQVDGAYRVEAATIDHQAAANTHTETNDAHHVGVDVSVTAKGGGLAEKINTSIDKVKKADFAGAVETVKSLKEVTMPNIGGNLTVDVTKDQASAVSTEAVVTTISADSVEVQTGSLHDVGTQYTASGGDVAIIAATHNSDAAESSTSTTSNHVEGGGKIRVATTTGKDITVDAQAQGSSIAKSESSTTQQGSQINAANNIDIQVDHDARYVGANMNAENINIVSGGDVSFVQANNTKTETEHTVSGDAALHVGYSKEVQGGHGSLNIADKQHNVTTVTAQPGVIQANDGITVESARDLSIQGTDISANRRIDLTAGEKLALKAAENTRVEKGSHVEVGLNAAGGKGSSEADNNVSAGINLGFGKTNNQDVGKQGSYLNAENISLSSDSVEKNALYLEGTKIDASSLTLNADRGNIVIESAKNIENHTNWGANLNADVDVGLSQDGSAGGALPHNAGAGVGVQVNRVHHTEHQNANIQADNLIVTAGQNFALSGAHVETNNVVASVGGNLTVNSLPNEHKEVSVNVSANQTHTNRKPEKVEEILAGGAAEVDEAVNQGNSALSEYLVDKVGLNKSEIGKTIKDAIDTGIAKLGSTLKGRVKNPEGLNGHVGLDVLDISESNLPEASTIIGKQSVNLDVGGDVDLNGATIQGPSNGINIYHGGNLNTESVAEHSYQGSANLNIPTSVDGIIDTVIQGALSPKSPIDRNEQSETAGGIVNIDDNIEQ